MLETSDQIFLVDKGDIIIIYYYYYYYYYITLINLLNTKSKQVDKGGIATVTECKL